MPIIRRTSRATASSSKSATSSILRQAILVFTGFLLGALFMVFVPSLYNAAEPSSLHRLMNPIRRNTLSARASSDILKLGNPGPVSDLLERSGYILSYNRRDRLAHWVGEHLTSASLQAGQGVDRDKSNFQEDTDIPEMFRAHLKDYVSSGYDRGHQAPAADDLSSQEAMDETFLLSNMAPQVGVGFNRHYWAYLEGFMRDLTQNFTDVYVYTGPLFLPSAASTGRKNPAYSIEYPFLGATTPNVPVPTHFFKIALTTTASSEYALGAFVLPNQAIDSSTPLTNFKVELEAIEKAAGLVFFDKLDRSKFADLCSKTTCQVR
uniref:Nuclease n=1 Tax=Syncephalastrum racemosum TaxID=13706 RepID=NUC1_SYNRA|nr:RecName: Full=Nuclease; AltName: Full=Sr-nuclease; Flags: Precursor [Syncephalastrum racemosum]AAC69516.1 nuclease [Syncephalastrum racemosum]